MESVALMRGVSAISLHRVAALAKLGLLPDLPVDVRNLNLHGREQDPSRAEILPLQWLIAGRDYAPSAIMAVRTKYDYAYSTEVLEVVHVAGSRVGVVRLIKCAQHLAKMERRPLTGEIDVQNVKMSDVLRKMGFTPERVRWTLEPKR